MTATKKSGVEATIDVDDLAGDVTCLVAGKERHKCGDLVGSAETAHGNELVEFALRQVTRHVGLDESRCDGVDSDLSPRDLLRQRLGGTDECRFRRTVVCLPRHPLHAR